MKKRLQKLSRGIQPSLAPCTFSGYSWWKPHARINITNMIFKYDVFMHCQMNINGLFINCPLRVIQSVVLYYSNNTMINNNNMTKATYTFVVDESFSRCCRIAGEPVNRFKKGHIAIPSRSKPFHLYGGLKLVKLKVRRSLLFQGDRRRCSLNIK